MNERAGREFAMHRPAATGRRVDGSTVTIACATRRAWAPPPIRPAISRRLTLRASEGRPAASRQKHLDVCGERRSCFQSRVLRLTKTPSESFRMVETPLGRLTMGNIMGRLGAAINEHDLDAFVSLFATDYQSDQPAHPMRSFSGAEKVRENWSSVFAGIRDLKAELLASATSGDGVELGEWYWHGTHLDRSPSRSAASSCLVFAARRSSGAVCIWSRSNKTAPTSTKWCARRIGRRSRASAPTPCTRVRAIVGHDGHTRHAASRAAYDHRRRGPHTLKRPNSSIVRLADSAFRGGDRGLDDEIGESDPSS